MRMTIHASLERSGQFPRERERSGQIPRVETDAPPVLSIPSLACTTTPYSTAERGEVCARPVRQRVVPSRPVLSSSSSSLGASAARAGGHVGFLISLRPCSQRHCGRAAVKLQVQVEPTLSRRQRSPPDKGPKRKKENL
jgi:hypothetical protein